MRRDLPPGFTLSMGPRLASDDDKSLIYVTPNHQR